MFVALTLLVLYTVQLRCFGSSKHPVSFCCVLVCMLTYLFHTCCPQDSHLAASDTEPPPGLLSKRRACQ